MDRGKNRLFCGLLMLILVNGKLCWAAENSLHAVTRETVLQWTEEYRDAQPGFRPGEVLRLSDLEKLRPFIPPGYLEEFRFPSVSFEIAPQGNYAPPKAFREATERSSGQTRLAADGSLEGYIAGQPFVNASLDSQDPTSGLKAMWNYNFRWQYFGPKAIDWQVILLRQGNTTGFPKELPPDLLQGEGRIERLMTLNAQRVYFSHLAMLPDTNYTLPVAGGEQLEWKMWIEFTSPYDVRGQEMIFQRYAGHHHEDDTWAYIPSLRKVRRISAEEKNNAFMGTDLIVDDFYGFFGLLLDYDWKFHGWKDVLHVMNSKWQDYPRYYGPGSWLPLDRWEIRRCAVVEQLPKDTKHPYSSRLLFIDAETYQPLLALAFDKEAKDLWKVMDIQYSWSEGVPQPPQVSIASLHGIVGLDVKDKKATVLPIIHSEYPRVTAEEAALLFDVNKLGGGRR